MTALAIHHGGQLANGADASAHLSALIDDVRIEAARQGWAGFCFVNFLSFDGFMGFEVRPAESAATLDDLRALRERLKQERQRAPEQGSLL